MDSKIIFFSITLLFSSAVALDITTVLDQYPSFSTFNRYLTQTHLAEEINARQPPFTILVVDNSNIGSLSGMSPDVLKKVMSVHVILNYYDAHKLHSLPGQGELATTLFQTTGQAVDNQGFLNITNLSNQAVLFVSRANGVSTSSNMVKPIEARPYDLSVLHISNVIIPSGIAKSTNSPTSSPVTNSSPANSPVSGPAKSSSPAKSPVSGPAKPPSPATPASGPAKPSSPAKSHVSSPAKPPSPSTPVSGPAKPPSPSTPQSPSPAKSPISAPAKSPVSSPAKSPVSGPAKSPASGPAPVSGLAKSPVSGPITSPASSPRKMLSPSPSPSETDTPSEDDSPISSPESSEGSPSPSPSETNTPPAAPKSSVETPSPSGDSSVGTALGVSAGIIAATLSSNLFLMLMA